MRKEPLLKGNASSAAFDVVNALGGIAPDPVPNGVSLNLKGKTVSTMSISQIDSYKSSLGLMLLCCPNHETRNLMLSKT
jgi:hypothetical protein